VIFYFLCSLDVSDSPASTFLALAAPTVQRTDPTQVPTPRSPNRKNWDGITQTILASEKEKTTEEDPNVTGDAQLNEFFQKIFADADDDAKKAMLKSFQESGGTTLSTNWDEVKRGPVEVKPPSGSEWRKWN
jgi:suppressor of G2 allele of SKP1